MLGQKDRRQPELFVAGSLKDLLPDDHVLVRVDKVLDLGWLEAAVADLYSMDKGRPCIAPEVAVRLMLAGMLLGIVHDRRLMREAQVNLAIRWFIGYGLHESLPDHSSLTRIRQRWGADRFRQIFVRTVQACIAAKVAKGEIVHVDSSLIRANVSWDAIARRHVDAVEAANPPESGEGRDDGPTPPRAKGKKIATCTSDPDATLSRNNKAHRSEPSYKHHTAVDAECGVVLDVAVTTGAVHDTKRVEAQLDAITATTGATIQAVTMDASYAITRVFADLEARGVEAVIPAKGERPRGGSLPQPPHPRRRLPWGGQDVARAGPSHPPWPRQHADPGLPRRRRSQPQAPGCRHRRSLHRIAAETLRPDRKPESLAAPPISSSRLIAQKAGAPHFSTGPDGRYNPSRPALRAVAFAPDDKGPVAVPSARNRRWTR